MTADVIAFPTGQRRRVTQHHAAGIELARAALARARGQHPTVLPLPTQTPTAAEHTPAPPAITNHRRAQPC